MSVVADVHSCETGQRLPPIPRQPGVQRPAAASQTRPEVAPPQSPSAVQPHWPLERQRAPARSASHAAVIVVVHSAHVLRTGSQTNGAAQSAVTRHSTQRPGGAATSHLGSGLVQSASKLQPVGAPHTPVPFMMFVHIRPAGQSFRGAKPQPGVQTPFGPLQTIPDMAPPQLASPAAPAQPHSPVAGKHSGFAPPHRSALLGEHSVQAPASGPDAWHAGRVGSGQLGPPSLVQGPQLRVVVEHTGVTPPQSVASRQPTQTPAPDEVSHSGRPAGQLLVLPGVQAPHAPLG